jgi:hypothetical protein
MEISIYCTYAAQHIIESNCVQYEIPCKYNFTMFKLRSTTEQMTTPGLPGWKLKKNNCGIATEQKSIPKKT